MTPGEGRSVRCDRCGGVIVLSTRVGSIRCSFCHHDQIVPPALFGELSAHQARLDEQNSRVFEHDRAELAHRKESVSDPLSLAALIVAFAPMLVFGGGNEIVKRLALLSPDVQRDVDGIVQFVTGIWWVAGTAGYLWYRRAQAKRRIRSQLREPLGSATCPSCGAPNAFVAGQVIERCNYCRAALAPHAEIMRRGLDAARLQERRARLDRLRTEQDLGGIALPSFLQAAYESVTTVLLAVLSLLAGYFVPILFLQDLPPLFASYKALITTGCWVMGVLVAAVAMALLIRSWTKRTAWQIAHAALASQLGAERTDPSGARHWFDGYWAGPLGERLDHRLSTFGAALTTTVDMFPVLVIVDTGPDLGNGFPSPRVSVFVAAMYPGQPPEISPTLRRNIHDRGFRVGNNEGGVRVDADDDVLKRLHEKPMAALDLSPLPGLIVTWVKKEGEPAPAW